MGIRQRRIEADYLKVKDAFEFLGSGFKSIDEKPNAQTTEKRYVNDASTSTSITGYKWQADVTADQIESNVAIEYMTSIGKELKTGSAAETEFIKVDLDKPSSTEGSFYARKFKIAVQVTEYPDNDGELGLNVTFMGLGDPVVGTFDTSSKAFTEGFTAATI